MSVLKDLSIKSISDMDQDEAIEHLRQIRLARRMPAKRKVAKKKKVKVTKMSPAQAAELLKLLK